MSELPEPPEGMEYIPEEKKPEVLSRLHQVLARAKAVDVKVPVVFKESEQYGIILDVAWDIETLLPVLEAAVWLREAEAEIQRLLAAQASVGPEAN